MRFKIPYAGRRQLYKVIIGIPEVEACPAQRPLHLALQRNPSGLQFCEPGIQIQFVDAEREVQSSMPVVRRDDPAGNPKGLGGCTSEKQNQHAALRHRHHAQARIFDEHRKIEQLPIECPRPGEITGIQAGFENRFNARHCTLDSTRLVSNPTRGEEAATIAFHESTRNAGRVRRGFAWPRGGKG